MGGGVMVEQVCEVGGGQVVKWFLGEQEDFELYTVWDGEPVQFLEDRGDVFSGAGEQAGSGVLNVLEFEEFGWWTV